MRYTASSILNFTPDSHQRIIEFRTPEEIWEHPLIGWAIVVNYTDDDTHETELEPVVLADHKFPLPLRLYLQDLAEPTTVEWQILDPGSTR